MVTRVSEIYRAGKGEYRFRYRALRRRRLLGHDGDTVDARRTEA